MSDAIRVIFTDDFERELKRLIRKYRHIGADIQPLIAALEDGTTPGDQLQDLAPAIVYKARLASRDLARGKSGGYRVIYYIKTATRILFLLIYPKSERDTVDTRILKQIILRVDAEYLELDTPSDSAVRH
ncbi:MAG: type II toxin-antitoxin system RelE/ParE family toxin [Chloroflexota bacterium]|nr:type II toxin-antitoxin system RelE/ParE family toxin [Chloroflexota bacterium]